MSLMIWFLVGLLIVALTVLFKYKEVRHKIGLVITVGICLFLIFSFIQVYNTNKVDLTTFDGVVHAGKIYFIWLGQIFENLKQTTSYVIKQDWTINGTLPKVK